LNYNSWLKLASGRQDARLQFLKRMVTTQKKNGKVLQMIGIQRLTDQTKLPQK
jgi:hypothetical protein